MELDFKKNKDGLIPAIIQDGTTNKVLMLGYMDQEALLKTKQEGKVTFFSRTKGRLWTKGEESGNFLYVKDVLIDCDRDTILIKTDPAGPVCHKGDDTCFKENNNSEFSLNYLEDLIKKRKDNPVEGSYTNSLFSKGINKIAQKVGEEAVELVIEAKDNDKDLFLGEAADLLYHYLVLLVEKDYTVDDVITVLKKRHK